jgi:hypothetical protein
METKNYSQSMGAITSLVIANRSNRSIDSFTSDMILMDAISINRETFCMCIPIPLAVKIITVYELYHIFTQYQSIYFVFGFKEKLSEGAFWAFLSMFVLNFGLFLTCMVKMLKYWKYPSDQKVQEGVVFGLKCVIFFDIITLILTLVLFAVVVNY